MIARLGTAVFAPLLLCACTGAEAGRAPLAVYAASSLTDAFRELEIVFERAHPEVDVALTFAGSQILRLQIESGAPADVFASADPEHVAALVESGLLSEGHPFAGNELVLVVPVDGPTRIEEFGQLPSARRLVLGTPQVPVGRYARQALSAADSLLWPGFYAAVLDRLASEEPNVRLARSKVELGEADAAIVYRTDAYSSDRLRTLPIPPLVNARAEYQIGPVIREGRSGATDAWIDLVLSPEGRSVLKRHGFLVE